MKKPFVSIVMPVYNVEKYLNAAIDSILAQTFRDFELILINDGSTDASGIIIDSYTDPRIVKVHKNNEGVALSLNYGFLISQGEFIRRFDADDTCTPTAIENQLIFLDHHPDVVLIGTQQAYQTDRGKVSLKYRMPRINYFNGMEYRIVKASDCYKECPIVHGTILIKKSILDDDIGYYRSEFLTGEDKDLFLRVIEKYPVAIINDCSYFLRLHNGSATVRYKHYNDFYREKVISFHKERVLCGTDPLIRGEFMQEPVEMVVSEYYNVNKSFFCRHVRYDLEFLYLICVDSKDVVNSVRLFFVILLSGWCKFGVLKMLVFPILGGRMLKVLRKVRKLYFN